MANPLLVIESGDDSEEKKDPDKKTAIAEDLLAAIKDNDLDATVDALTAFYRICALDD